MKIYLNTRGFTQDYQWFNIAEDNSISISRNWWEMREISKLPITDDFSIILGKLESGESFLLVTDAESRRVDSKGRSINSSFLFISNDEIRLRKLTSLFLFDYEDLIDKLEFVISDYPDSEFGFSVEYTQVILAMETLLEKYSVQFEFDADINENYRSRFGELYVKYSENDSNGKELIGYQLNPIFELKLKRFLLGEIFPEDVTILFSYFPHLTLQDIENGQIYLAVGKELDKLAKNIFIQDNENWAEIDMREPRFKKLKDKIKRYRSEMVVISLIMFIFIPLISSYFSLSTINSELKKENNILEIDKLKIEADNLELSKELKTYYGENGTKDNPENTKDRLKIAEDINAQLLIELDGAKSVITTLKKKLHKRGNLDLNQDLNNDILTLRNNLGKCESDREKDAIQRKKLVSGYKWYQDLYNRCKEKN